MTQSDWRAIVRRFSFISMGIAGITSAVFNPFALAFPERAVPAAGGLFLLYFGSMYWWPKYRNRQKEVNETLDEVARRMNELD